MELRKEWGTKNPEILQNPEIPKFLTTPTQVILLAPKAALKQQAADFPLFAPLRRAERASPECNEQPDSLLAMVTTQVVVARKNG